MRASATQAYNRRQMSDLFLPLVFSRWFCHFDDDNYVNVPALIRKLREFDHTKEWYLGKPSIPEPLEILDRDSNNQQVRRACNCKGNKRI